MGNHLSQDELAKYIAGTPASGDVQHVTECPECSAEVERFGQTLALFRNAVRDRIDDRVAFHPLPPAPSRRTETGISTLRSVWVAAAAAALFIPFFISQNKPQSPGEPVSGETNPAAIMDRVNLHLSRTVPAPMEPMMSLIPSEELVSNPGGVQ